MGHPEPPACVDARPRRLFIRASIAYDRGVPRFVIVLACALALAACEEKSSEDGGANIDGFVDGGAPGCGACTAACAIAAADQLQPGWFLLAADASGLAWSS